MQDLHDLGPVRTLDRALALVRSGVVPMRQSFAAGGLVALVVLGIHYVERVEGITLARPLLALALALAFLFRGVVLSGAARRAVRALSPKLTVPPDAGRVVDVMRTSGVVGLGLSVWLLLPIFASYLGPFAVPFALPFLAARGAVAPSWLARAGVTSRAGVRGFLDAVGDQDGRRVSGVLVELLVSLGAIGLAANLYVALSFALVLGRSLLGLDLAVLDVFVSTRNVFVLLAVGAMSLVLLEPLRVALSATYFVDAQIRREGLDLYAAIDEAERAATRRGRGRAATSAAHAAVMLLAVALSASLAPPSVALAQPLGDAGAARDAAEDAAHDVARDVATSVSEVGEAPIDGDEAVRAEARRILAGSEFDEFAEGRGRGLRTLLERLLAYLLRPRDTPELGVRGVGLPMPPVWAFVAFGGLLAAIVLAAVFAQRSRSQPKDERAGTVTTEAADPRDRPPEAHLDDAALLASRGLYRDALRSLYLATLVSLDRRRLITFNPTRTNWHYLREMPKGARRDDFGTFTRLFDHKWYGDEETTAGDYAACRALADGICAEELAR